MCRSRHCVQVKLDCFVAEAVIGRAFARHVGASQRRSGNSQCVNAAQANVALTFPSPANFITTLSPAFSHTVLTRLPVSTISSARRPLPSAARWLASQASALCGMAQHVGTGAVPDHLAVDHRAADHLEQIGRGRPRHARPSTQPAAKKSSATSVGAPMVSHST